MATWQASNKSWTIATFVCRQFSMTSSHKFKKPSKYNAKNWRLFYMALLTSKLTVLNNLKEGNF